MRHFASGIILVLTPLPLLDVYVLAGDNRLTAAQKNLFQYRDHTNRTLTLLPCGPA